MRKSERLRRAASERAGGVVAVGKQMSELLKTTSKLTPTFRPGKRVDISVTKCVGGGFFLFYFLNVLCPG